MEADRRLELVENKPRQKIVVLCATEPRPQLNAGQQTFLHVLVVPRTRKFFDDLQALQLVAHEERFLGAQPEQPRHFARQVAPLVARTLGFDGLFCFSLLDLGTRFRIELMPVVVHEAVVNLQLPTLGTFAALAQRNPRASAEPLTSADDFRAFRVEGMEQSVVADS